MTVECARCGADVGAGGLDVAAAITDLDPDSPGGLVTLRLCRANGCATRVLTKAALRHHRDTGGERTRLR